jgi:hypothetical protein
VSLAYLLSLPKSILEKVPEKKFGFAINLAAQKDFAEGINYMLNMAPFRDHLNFKSILLALRTAIKHSAKDSFKVLFSKVLTNPTVQEILLFNILMRVITESQSELFAYLIEDGSVLNTHTINNMPEILSQLIVLGSQTNDLKLFLTNPKVIEKIKPKWINQAIRKSIVYRNSDATKILIEFAAKKLPATILLQVFSRAVEEWDEDDCLFLFEKTSISSKLPPPVIAKALSTTIISKKNKVALYMILHHDMMVQIGPRNIQKLFLLAVDVDNNMVVRLLMSKASGRITAAIDKALQLSVARKNADLIEIILSLPPSQGHIAPRSVLQVAEYAFETRNKHIMEQLQKLGLLSNLPKTKIRQLAQRYDDFESIRFLEEKPLKRLKIPAVHI